MWWDDIKGKVRRVARAKAEEFEEKGIRGVDLYIATFGPTLAILSESWPVLTSDVDEQTGEPKPLRPEVALELVLGGNGLERFVPIVESEAEVVREEMQRFAQTDVA